MTETTDQPIDMWEYWRNKTNHVFGVEEYYTNLLRKNPDLQVAVSTINNAERAIDKIFEELEEC